MGSHSSVVLLFEDVTKALSDKGSFGYGSADDFNSIKDKKWPYTWLDPLTGGFPNTTEGNQVSSTITWNISLNFLDLDEKSGNEEQTARVWDTEFDRMEAWLHKMDREFINSPDQAMANRIASDLVSIQNPTWVSRRKDTVSFSSGWTLTFQLITQSDFDYCSIYDED